MHPTGGTLRDLESPNHPTQWGCGGGCAAPADPSFRALAEPRLCQSAKNRSLGGSATLQTSRWGKISESLSTDEYSIGVLITGPLAQQRQRRDHDRLLKRAGCGIERD